MSVIHPGNVMYSTKTRSKTHILAGIDSRVFPLSVYATAILISDNLSRTSSLVTAKCVYPLIILVYLRTTKSNQPHRRLRPVVTPTSLPTLCRYSPVESNNSVANVPLPTRVYKYKIIRVLKKHTKTTQKKTHSQCRL